MCVNVPIIHNSFPDLVDLKEKISSFRSRSLGWPTCIIKANVTQVFRPNIDGPLSLFTNIKGTSYCNVGNGNITIDESTFLISNSQQIYTLEIDSSESTQTLNIHFGDDLTQSVMQVLTQEIDYTLENINHFSPSLPVFFNNLNVVNSEVGNLLTTLHKTDSNDVLKMEELLASVLEKILLTHRQTLKASWNLPHIKLSSKTEVYKRLLIGRDYIHSHISEPISLQEIANAATMSKFHFLRSFRDAFGKTPHQMLTAIRLEKAKNLLCSTDFPISDIILLVGFESISSFSLLFKKSFGSSPQSFRLLKKSNFR